jgi:hypothetical protein
LLPSAVPFPFGLLLLLRPVAFAAEDAVVTVANDDDGVLGADGDGDEEEEGGVRRGIRSAGAPETAAAAPLPVLLSVASVVVASEVVSAALVPHTLLPSWSKQ